MPPYSLAPGYQAEVFPVAVLILTPGWGSPCPGVGDRLTCGYIPVAGVGRYSCQAILDHRLLLKAEESYFPRAPGNRCEAVSSEFLALFKGRGNLVLILALLFV